MCPAIDLAKEFVVGGLKQEITQPDDHHVERGVNEVMGFVQRPAYSLTLGFGQVDDGLQPASDFPEGVDWVG